MNIYIYMHKYCDDDRDSVCVRIQHVSVDWVNKAKYL